uniref:Uncharacterized protein n=1 Tax=Romanomermis culicivorax TaxID=13658 RepID=A0A915I2X0_ROMCU
MKHFQSGSASPLIQRISHFSKRLKELYQQEWRKSIESRDRKK